jgi:predicted DNA-binding protein YlxM (UPF0122 family)
MTKVPIGLIIKIIVQENNLSVQRIADEMKLTRQAVYATYKRTSMHEGEKKEWARALKVSPDRLSEEDFNQQTTTKTVETPSFGDEVLQTIRKLLEEEIKEKNEQIRALQDALKESQKMSSLLLGKSHEYLNLNVMPMYAGVYAPGAIS